MRMDEERILLSKVDEKKISKTEKKERNLDKKLGFNLFPKMQS